MFNPEFRILFTQEIDNEMPLFDQHVVSALFICGFNVFVIAIMCLFIYNYVNPLKFLWQQLTPGNELLEISVILTSLFAAYMLITVVKDLGEALHKHVDKLNIQIEDKKQEILNLTKKIDKLKNEIEHSKRIVDKYKSGCEERDEKIRQLTDYIKGGDTW